MQENINLFNKIPYKTKVRKGTPLLAEHAQEAIEDLLSDTSVFLTMPKLTHILQARSESSYGSHKLILTLAEGVSYPEYMLNARVAALSPKIVNVFFETIGFQEEEEAFMQMQYTTASQGTMGATAQAPLQQESAMSDVDASCISEARAALGISYQELGESIGYDPQELTRSVALGKISIAMQKALELYLENVALKKKLEALR